MSALVGLALAYVVGAFPTAYLAGRSRGVDLAAMGSGNYGATNVYRSLGAGPAVLVLVVDVLKGYLPVALIPQRAAGPIDPAAYAVLVGLAAVLGHVFSIFLRFRGGKGIGTAAGAFLALAPVATMAAAIVWFAVVAWRRIVSLASLSAAVTLLVAVWAGEAAGGAMNRPLVIATTALTGFVFWTHRANIRRLRRGDETPIRAGRRP